MKNTARKMCENTSVREMTDILPGGNDAKVEVMLSR